MKQKTLQEQYNLIKEGKGNTDAFIKSAKRQFPAQIRNSAGLTETVNSLKHNHIISENIWGIATESDKTPDWFSIFDKNMKIIAEEAKAVEKKTTKEVEDKLESITPENIKSGIDPNAEAKKADLARRDKIRIDNLAKQATASANTPEGRKGAEIAAQTRARLEKKKKRRPSLLETLGMRNRSKE